MNAAELIKILSRFPADAVVVLSKDGEGNDYRPLDAFSDTRAVLVKADVPWGDYVRDVELYDPDEHCPQGCDGEAHRGYECGPILPEDAVPAVVLWPTY